MNIKPLNDNLLIDRLPDVDTKSSGLILEQKDSNSCIGVVLAKGPKVSLGVGTKIYYNKFAPDEIIVEGKKLYLIREQYVLAYEQSHE